MGLEELRKVILEEAQRQAEEILRSAEEEIARLRSRFEAEQGRLERELDEESEKALEQLREKWKLETEYEKRTIRSKLVNEAIEVFKEKLMKELVQGEGLDRYVTWLTERVPDADEWLVDDRYEVVAERLEKLGVKVTRAQGGVMAKKGKLLLDLSPEAVVQSMLELFAHEIYEQVAKIVP
ncbi:hypothetical protein HPY42_03530 [Coprothermobacteraceae bacterium]|nr:hypothetical protein [Coprothermobacteraceae bacterium]